MDRERSPPDPRQSRGQHVLLAEAIASSPAPPRVFVSGSAVGIYGDTGDREVDERSAPGRGFLAEVVQQWKRARRLRGTLACGWCTRA
ncbi:MAG: hypothetical protein U0163_09785 [Gemmatimonadaceae bacterium]